MNLISITLSLLVSLVASQSSGGLRVDHVSPVPALQNINVSYSSTSNSFDSPHITGITLTDYEWWWFDAESSDLSTTMTIIFFTNSPAAFQLTAGLPITSVIVNGKLPNGTVFQSEAGALSGATIKSGGQFGNGAQGVWDSIGNFTVAPDLSSAVVNIDLYNQPSLPVPIRGTMKFKSVAPPHYPCTKNLNNGNPLQIVPHVGWSNAMPGASVQGTFEIPGQKFTVNGFGYHDKNWGDTLFEQAIKEWFWGHATFGPWSVVFFNGTDAHGNPFADAYVSKNGQLLVSSCKPGSVRFDPKFNALNILDSAVVQIALPDGGTLKVTVVSKIVQNDYPLVYTRTSVKATGGEVGSSVYSGVGTVEHFTF